MSSDVAEVEKVLQVYFDGLYEGDTKKLEFEAIARIDTPEELVAFRHGGILPYVLRQLVGKR